MKRRRMQTSARVPNEEIRWFICSSAAALRERGGYSDGFTSHGEPDPFPYSEHEIGYCLSERVEFRADGSKGYVHGHGTIERARECRLVWHAIGPVHREVLAAYYGTREPGRIDTPDGSERVSEALQGTRVDAALGAMRVPPEVMRTRGMRLELAGVATLLHCRGQKTDLIASSLTAIRVAHEVWQIERDQIDRASDVRWKTEAL